MDTDGQRPLSRTQEAHASPGDPTPSKQPWQEPKLTFIEPTLTKHGTLQELTGQGFFGGFSP